MPPQLVTPGTLNIVVEPCEGPQDTSFYLPQAVPGGVKVLMFGGWSKVDALAAQYLLAAAIELIPDEPTSIAPEIVSKARRVAGLIVEALAPQKDPAMPPDPKPLIVAAGESC